MPWLKLKKTYRQIIVHLKQHRKLKTEQHEPHQNLGMIAGALDGKADPALQMAFINNVCTCTNVVSRSSIFWNI